MNFKIADSKFKELLLPTLLIVMALNISAVVDSFFVGRFIGENAVAAIDLLEPIILLITVFEWLFGLGGQIIALNKKAEFDEDGSNLYFSASLVASLIASVLMAIICFIFIDPIAVLLGGDSATKPLIIQYSTFLYGCFVVSTIAGVLTQYIRVDGQPNFSSMVIIIANIINIILDYLFLSSGMGMASASAASFIGYTIGLIVCLLYVRNPKRTFRFVRAALNIKNFITATAKMIKVGFPGASIGVFDVIFVLILNRFIVAAVGNIGLTTYMICADTLVLASIIDIGVAETLTSIVPIYYVKHDFVNIKHLIKLSLIITMVCAIAMFLFLAIWPQGFLEIYGFNKPGIGEYASNALRLYSLFFPLSVLPNILIFYYEAIERSTLSTVLSILFTLAFPLLAVIGFYDMLGSNGMWLGFGISCILTTIVIYVTVKLIQRKESQYSGLFFFEEGLMEKTRNFVLTDNDLEERKECIQHLKDLNADDTFCDNTNKIFDEIFNTNDHGTPVEVLVIDYDDNIHLDIKYDGEKENLEHLKKIFPEDLLKYAEVLGFNTIEYVMDK